MASLPEAKAGPAVFDIVIVNWNAGPLLQQCIESIFRAEKSHLVRVTVVDNGSADASLDAVASFPIKIMRNDDNLGFGRACNQGARNGDAPILLFLNPDTVVDPFTFAALAEMATAPEAREIGVWGAKLIGEDGAVQKHCTYAPTAWSMAGLSVGLNGTFFPRLFMTDFSHEETRAVDHVIGAFYAIRRTLFDQLGGFDENFFVYFEDLDLSERVRKLGWTILFASQVSAVHVGGGVSRKVKARRLSYVIRSRLYYARKHFGPAGATLVYGATFLVEPVARIVRALLHGSPREALNTIKGYALLLERSPHRRSA